jgi:hypothetical protein
MDKWSSPKRRPVEGGLHQQGPINKQNGRSGERVPINKGSPRKGVEEMSTIDSQIIITGNGKKVGQEIFIEKRLWYNLSTKIILQWGDGNEVECFKNTLTINNTISLEWQSLQTILPKVLCKRPSRGPFHLRT